MNVSERAASAARTTVSVVLGEIRFVVATFGRAFLRAGGLVALLTVALFAVTYPDAAASVRTTASPERE